MKINIDENDIVKHWGIWINNDEYENWLSNSTGEILHFLCPRVANAQFDLLWQSGEFSPDDMDVREIK